MDIASGRGAYRYAQILVAPTCCKRALTPINKLVGHSTHYLRDGRGRGRVLGLLFYSIPVILYICRVTYQKDNNLTMRNYKGVWHPLACQFSQQSLYLWARILHPEVVWVTDSFSSSGARKRRYSSESQADHRFRWLLTTARYTWECRTTTWTLRSYFL